MSTPLIFRLFLRGVRFFGRGGEWAISDLGTVLLRVKVSLPYI